MRFNDWVRQRVLKIVNSRCGVMVMDNYMVRLNLRRDLYLTEVDFRKMIAMTEHFFKVVISDEQLERLRSVQDITDLLVSMLQERSDELIKRTGDTIIR